MFRLAAFSDEISQDLAHVCRVLNDFGARGVELRRVWNTPVQDLTDGQVSEIRGIVEDNGLDVCSVASPFGKCELDDAGEIAAHMDMLRRCTEIGHALGCSLIRGFAFWGHGKRNKPWDKMSAAYEPVLRILEDGGATLGLENEAACYVGTGRHLRKFLDLIDCPQIKATWDPANHIHDPDNDEQPVFPDGYEAVAADMVHVHVKDAAVLPDGQRANVFLGEGQCQWHRQFRAFKRDGYEGYVSLETHVDPERFPESLRERYGRYLTGEGREGPSKASLAWLRNALAELDSEDR